MMEPPGAPCGHALRRRLADPEHAVEIDLHHTPPFLLAGPQKERAGRHARVVDQDGDGPRGVLGRIEGTHHGGSARDIELERPRLAPAGTNLPFQPLQAVEPACRYDNLRSGARQHARKMLPEARGGSSHECGLAGEREHAEGHSRRDPPVRASDNPGHREHLAPARVPVQVGVGPRHDRPCALVAGYEGRVLLQGSRDRLNALGSIRRRSPRRRHEHPDGVSGRLGTWRAPRMAHLARGPLGRDAREVAAARVAAAMRMPAGPGVRAGEAQHGLGKAEPAFLSFLGCHGSRRSVRRAVAERLAQHGLEFRHRSGARPVHSSAGAGAAMAMQPFGSRRFPAIAGASPSEHRCNRGGAGLHLH